MPVSDAPNPIVWFDAEVTMTRVLRIMVPADIMRPGETPEDVAKEMADRGGEDHPDFVQVIEEEYQLETLERRTHELAEQPQ